MSSDAVLPPLYARWMTTCLGGAIPAESRATCLDCAMLADDASQPGLVHFDARTKCCTYTPDLPNFLVGMILAEAQPTPALRARIRAGASVTPLGVAPTPVESRRYDRLLLARFGKEPELRCPYYVDEAGGLCGLWPHRNSVCSTWFCKHVRGVVARDLWSAIERLLGLVESTLARWCVDEAGLDDDDWQPEAWFADCARRVAALDWGEVAALSPELLVRAQLARAAYEHLLDLDIPEGIERGRFDVRHRGERAARVKTYNHHDILELPVSLLDALRRFDGRPTETVLAELDSDEGVHLTRALVRHLLDFELLVPARRRN